MFREIRVGNFKGFAGSHSLELGKINLFYGANSAGKSALLEAFLLMKQSIRRNSVAQDQGMEAFLFNGSNVDLGSFQATINGHNVSKKLQLGGSYEVEVSTILGEQSKDIQHFDVEVAWDYESKSQILESCTYRIDNAPDNTITFKRLKDNAKEISITPVDILGFNQVAEMVAGLASSRLTSVEPISTSEAKSIMLNAKYENWSFLPGMPSPISIARTLKKKMDFDAIQNNQEKLSAIKKEVEKGEKFADDLRSEGLQAIWRDLLSQRFRDTANSLSGIRYLGPLRKFPTRIERLVEKSKVYVGREGEGVASILHRDPSIVMSVNRYMRKMGIPYELHVRKLDPDGAGTLGEIIALQLVDLRSNVILSLEDVGFGISQVLPLLVQLAISRSDLILIEQPELHLHPAIQAHFGDLLIEGISSQARNQFIIETHSEHLLLRLQRRIREGSLASSDLRVYFIDATSELGSFAQEIELDEQGEFITPWPNGFFPERLDEMLA